MIDAELVYLIKPKYGQ